MYFVSYDNNMRKTKQHVLIKNLNISYYKLLSPKANSLQSTYIYCISAGAMICR